MVKLSLVTDNDPINLGSMSFTPMSEYEKMDIKIDGVMHSLQTALTSDSDIYTPIPPELVDIITKWVSSTPHSSFSKFVF